MSVTQFGSRIGSVVDHARGTTHSAEELRTAVTRRSAALWALGLRPGEKVILTHGSSFEFFADLFALWQLGVCAAPVDPLATQTEIATLAEHCQAGLIITGDDQTPPTTAPVRSVSTAELAGGAQARLSQAVTSHWDDAALMLYTSGSTGEPKGVLHTFRSVMARMSLLRRHVDPVRLTRSLNLLPTYFGHGLLCNCLYPLLNGCSLVILKPFNLEILSQLGTILDEHRVTFMSSVPAVWRMALRVARPPQQGSVDMVHCGSAPLRAELRRSIGEWTGASQVKNTYGITETGSWLAGTEDDKTDFIDGYIGPGWGTEFLILDENSLPTIACRTLPVGAVGMVWVHTPALMKEYYRRPDLTARAIHNTWFNTGDVGYLDDNGSLVLVGRKRHEINKAGMKIYPEDVDRVLEQHPDIAEACTFAVEDPIAGENVAAAIVPSEVDGLNTAELEPWLRAQLSPHKIPIKWFVVPEIPKSSRGKVNREAVARSCIEGDTDAGF